MSHAASRAMCRSNRTRDVREVVGDELHDELRNVPRHPDARCRRSNQTRSVVEVVDNEPHDEPCHVPRHPDAQRGRSSRRRAV
jgi:hypothetical protein